MTLAEAETLRTAWMDAEKAVATGQAYTIGGRTLTRVDAAYIGRRLAYYDNLVASLRAGVGGGVTVKRVIPVDW